MTRRRARQRVDGSAAIDNSAGVDLSDHEVNLKIALAPSLASGEITRAERDALLLEIADESCERVLAHNSAQALVALARRAPREARSRRLRVGDRVPV
ncbi:MAG: NAD-glutamate dehydrogenase [Aquincola sp.]|nr:NAD-glutamate dehydrogenase [Aquincola sp.]